MLGKKRVIEIIALHIEGKSVVEIGKAVNLSKSRVAQILKEPENQRLMILMIEQIALQKADQIAEGKTELEKIKYHILLINSRMLSIDGEISRDFHSDSIASLVIEMDWSEDDLKNVRDIFHKYSEKLREGKQYVNWSAFQHDICDALGRIYDDRPIKDIIVAFWRHREWKCFCAEYAKEYRCAEFHVILGL